MRVDVGKCSLQICYLKQLPQLASDEPALFHTIHNSIKLYDVPSCFQAAFHYRATAGQLMGSGSQISACYSRCACSIKNDLTTMMQPASNRHIYQRPFCTLNIFLLVLCHFYKLSDSGCRDCYLQRPFNMKSLWPQNQPCTPNKIKLVGIKVHVCSINQPQSGFAEFSCLISRWSQSYWLGLCGFYCDIPVLLID